MFDGDRVHFLIFKKIQACHNAYIFVQTGCWFVGFLKLYAFIVDMDFVLYIIGKHNLDLVSTNTTLSDVNNSERNMPFKRYMPWHRDKGKSMKQLCCIQ